MAARARDGSGAPWPAHPTAYAGIVAGAALTLFGAVGPWSSAGDVDYAGTRGAGWLTFAAAFAVPLLAATHLRLFNARGLPRWARAWRLHEVPAPLYLAAGAALSLAAAVAVVVEWIRLPEGRDTGWGVPLALAGTLVMLASCVLGLLRGAGRREEVRSLPAAVGSALGLTPARWRALPAVARRAATFVLAGLGALLLSVFVNVLERSYGQAEGAEALLTFDWSAYIAFGVLFLLLVPPWGRLPRPSLAVALGAAAAAIVLLLLVVGLALDEWALALFSSAAVAVVAAPPYERRRERRAGAPAEGGRVLAVGKKVLPIGIGLLAVLYPFYLDRMFEIPVFGAFPNMSTAVVMAVFAIMAIGLNMVVGYAGLLDLGYVAFYAMGAYTAAWLASPHFAGQNPDGTPKRDFDFGAVGVLEGIGGIHISIWLLLLVAACLTALIGVLIGLPTLRLRGDYLAIVTLGFGEIMPQIARNGDNLFGTGLNLTNGPQGINPVDAPGFGNTLSDATGGFLPSNYLICCNDSFLKHPISSIELFYWTTLALVLFTIFCSIRLRDSRLGRAWIAIREDETAAAAMGVPLMRTKTWAYAAGAFFGGISGCMFAAYKTGVFPDDFYFNISVFILCMVILGGMGNIWGVLVGACFLVYLDQEGLANTGSWINNNLGTAIDVPKYSFGIYGLIIVIVMLLRPQGLIPSQRRKQELERGVHDEPLYDATHR